MRYIEIPIEIPDNPYSWHEQFISVAQDFEIGSAGTIRIGGHSFLDGEAVYLNVHGSEIRRDAGFQKPLEIAKRNQDSRWYVFRAGFWYQQTASPISRLTTVQRLIGQYGFWYGIHIWCCEVGRLIAGLIFYCLAPVIVVPALVLQATHFIVGLVGVLLFCLLIWSSIFDLLCTLFYSVFH